ncbi:MAG: Flagellin N-methylase [Verrucomicrobiales bacterium]|nr:Flagellin N-methylase [Verrucomicrobiales bacterium]
MANPLHHSVPAGQSLCASCGFCCNGVLFTAVTLQSTDKPEQLIELGLDVKRRGRGFRFAQPCVAFKSGRCSIYQQRPGHCAKFDCRLLQKLNLGDISLIDAIETVKKAKEELAKLETSLKEAGDANPELALNTRFRRVMSQPLDLSAGPAFWKTRSRLTKAVQRFTAMVEKRFLD